MPVNSWSNQDSAFLSIASKIRNIVDDLEDQNMSTRSENQPYFQSKYFLYQR
jgi:hypothetical protein